MQDELRRFVEQLPLPVPRVRESAPPLVDGQELYTMLLNNELVARFGQPVYEQVNQVQTRYADAVVSCRQNALAEAVEALGQADTLMQHLQPAPALQFVTLFKLSAWGYYQHKSGRGEEALASLAQGLAISAELERQGFTVLIHRRLEQIRNIAQIHAKQSRLRTAVAMLTSALTFIQGGPASNMCLQDWDGAAVRQTRILQESSLDACFQELSKYCSLYTSDEEASKQYFNRNFFAALRDELVTDTNNRITIYNWLFVNCSLHEEGIDAFLANSLEFIHDADVLPAYDMFKANLLTQVACLCKKHLSASDAACRLQEIKLFAEKNLIRSACRPPHLLL